MLVVATGIAGGLVWKLSAGSGGLGLPRPHRVRFDESLEITSIPMLEPDMAGTGAIAFEERPAEPPHRTWSIVRLVVLIAGLAGIGAGTIWAAVHFLNLALAERIQTP